MNQIKNDVLTFIQQHPAIGTPNDDQDFNQLALKIFKYQFEHNLPFKSYAKHQRKTPLLVHDWTQIPLMPIRGYKYLSLSATPITPDEPVFMSSGTTDPTHRSRNYHPTFETWDASMKGPFKQFVMPDRDRMRIIGLFPGADVNPHSSLSRYVSKALAFFGDDQSHIYVNEHAMDFSSIVGALQTAIKQNEPVMLLGASFSYVHLLDYLRQHDLHFQLPAASRIFDTGGFKGQSRELGLNDLLQQLSATFGVARDHHINMYGMTEVCSQCYDRNLFDMAHHQPVHDTKLAPAWVRIRILDPDTLAPVQAGQTGLIAYYDLTNWNSCVGILTEDLGVQSAAGFKLLGRIKGAEAKGCSIAIDQLLTATNARGQK
ncbi:acyl-CoA synthetase [Nicoliella spurrieriana]|uniref:Acyl-CoA synthetase n=1 Tax=Nicoliella spurrieriana TaxID=2925830 RepID=A0A976RTB1_9LACO|nr:acyl-CoA synthetase [Nicoliella spurrieriana]UQS87442.1 acyl-CoA synthetase [Nicoliella spurrieriana]